MRGEEIEARFTALLERLREAYLGPALVQVDQRKSQPAVERFKYDRPPADLARIPPQLRRAPAALERRHGDWAKRRHRASDRSVILLELSSHANFALSTAVPRVGPHDARSATEGTRSCTARHAAQAAGEAGGVSEVRTAQIGALRGDGGRCPGFCGSTAPRIVSAHGALRNLPPETCQRVRAGIRPMKRPGGSARGRRRTRYGAPHPE